MNDRVVVIEDEVLVQPDVHDAEVRGLLLLSDRRLLIVLRAVDGLQRYLMLHGVERLKADDFRQGNIVLDITVSPPTSLDIKDVADAYGVAPSDSSFLPGVMDRLKREGLLLVRLNPSYGCSLVCVCQGIGMADDITTFLPR